MKIKKIPIIYLFCINIIFTQEKYLSPDDVKVEWQNYTSFQRQELVNFATFLFDEQFYALKCCNFQNTKILEKINKEIEIY